MPALPNISRPNISRRLMLGLPLGLIATGAGIGLINFRNRDSVIQVRGRAMGTSLSVIAVDPSGQVDEQQIQGLIQTALTAADQHLSNWQADSELSRLNSLAAGDSLTVSDDLFRVLTASEEIHAATQGRFDVAMGDLINLWGFGTTGPRSDRPSAYAVDSLREATNMTAAFTLGQNRQVHKGEGQGMLFIPSIGKGAGVDTIAAGLRDLGLENFMVEIGGDLVTAGLNPDGEEWQIGIERPVANTAPGSGVDQILGISGMAMATPGDYRSFFEVDGQRYSRHIIDPATGAPITHTTASVTVFAEDAMQADAWSTALLVMGHEEGLEFANSRDLAALFIERTGKHRYDVHTP